MEDVTNWSPCFGFNCKVFYESGINMVNSHILPGIQPVFG